MRSSGEMSKNIGKMAKGKHPGFKAVAAKVQKKEGVSKDSAGAIVAAASRNASPVAKKKNPKLSKVPADSSDYAG